MQIDALKLVYFSPTETSRTTAVAIARGVGASRITEINLTLPQADDKDFPPVTDSLAIIAMPVYTGRLPEVAANRLRRVQGNGTPAVVLVLYGNRAYEDALIELRDVATEAGFVPVAGGAFLGEHSFANAQFPIAANRPDVEDASKAKAFGESVRAMLNAARSLDDFGPLQVPGNVPYQDYRVPKNIAPVILDGQCTVCGLCALLCPTNAIAFDGKQMVTDASKCILCCACTKRCPTAGRVLNDERIEKVRGMLTSKFSERREPETFLAK